MTVSRYRRKPQQKTDSGVVAAQYQPGEPLGDLAEVAAMAPHGEIAECRLPSGPVLVAAYLDIPDDHPSRPAYAIVRPGDWLYYSENYGHLGDDTTRSLNHWYDLEAP